MPGIGRLEAVTLDVADLDRATAFWSGVLGMTFGPSVMPQFRRGAVAPGVAFVLQQVPERKPPLKNRMHIDVEVADVDEALRQVEALGGSFVREVQDEGFDPFHVCTDPDGNEFCLVLPTREEDTDA